MRRAAPGSREAEALALLGVVGLQQVGHGAGPAREQATGLAAEHRPV